LDDPGSRCPPCTSSHTTRSAQRHRPDGAMTRPDDLPPDDVFHAARLPFDPGSPKYGVLRGGALEPGAAHTPRNSQAKAAAYSAANSPALGAQQDLSLSGGASSLDCRVSSWASPRFDRLHLSLYDEGRPSGSPSLETAYASNQLAHMPPGEVGRRVVRALRGAHWPAGVRNGDGRFGEERSGVCMPLHGVCRRYCRIRE
jgi:hypothetical protein